MEFSLIFAILIKVVGLLILGIVIKIVCERLGFPIPTILQQLYLLLVALIAISMAYSAFPI